MELMLEVIQHGYLVTAFITAASETKRLSGDSHEIT